MPNTIIHGIIPYILASVFTENKILKWIALIGGMFPDLDGIPILFDTNLYYQIHHELLHPPFIGFVIALPVALIVKKLYGIKIWKTYLAFSLGYLLHSLVDVFFTNWYVKLLWPFSQEKFSYPIFLNLNFVLAFLVSLWILFNIFKFIIEKKNLLQEIKKLLPKKVV
ncbi:MAG: metal-dependent hydrolase [Candidatus ainarchaeum sp.]|jgi:membrane-bound metal-dependent hydrolase YbcI (DUF457 family)|nr:metal-dependent hydrolase [Candidatus ainarchaeum sp.]MDD3085655.1 metal-dependent hydrolase [Candidatus ainarchaeum sp.]HPM85830.1 metal-dependent hydrolase [archaeon]